MRSECHARRRQQRSRPQRPLAEGPLPESERPHKKPEVSQADVNHFKETLVDAVIQGKPAKLSRHELLLHKMYEQALKGSVLIQRKLFDRFEQSDDTFEEAEFHLRHLGKQIVAGHDKNGKIDEGLYEEYRRLYFLLQRREHHEAVNEPLRRPRNRSRATPVTPTWRKGPKPQAILDLEREWAEAEAAEKAARARNDDDTDESGARNAIRTPSPPKNNRNRS